MTSTDQRPEPRKTRQRTAVTAVMSTMAEFRTAQEVHTTLREQDQSIGLATVYRILTQLADSGEIDSIRTPDGQAAYRLCSNGHHHHLICRQCGRTVEITPPSFEQWTRQVAAENGFTELNHELELFGLCAQCGSA